MNGQSSDDSASDKVVNDNIKQRRNEAIFKNMTFDSQGQPII